MLHERRDSCNCAGNQDQLGANRVATTQVDLPFTRAIGPAAKSAVDAPCCSTMLILHSFRRFRLDRCTTERKLGGSHSVQPRRGILHHASSETRRKGRFAVQRNATRNHTPSTSIACHHHSHCCLRIDATALAPSTTPTIQQSLPVIVKPFSCLTRSHCTANHTIEPLSSFRRST